MAWRRTSTPGLWLLVAVVLQTLLGLFATSDALSANGPRPATSTSVERDWYLERLRGTGALSDLEYGTARSDHAEVAQAVARCHIGFENPVAWSASTRAVLMFELGDTLSHTVLRPQTMDKLGEVPKLTFYQKAAVGFSDKLSRDRLATRYELEQSQRWASICQFATVALGALATIAIGVRSVIVKENPYVTAWATLAITFSALGTAAATLGTYGDFQSKQLRASRSLAQLQQLHWRVASDIMKSPMLCSDKKDEQTAQSDVMDAWRERYETIRDSAMDTLARPGNLSAFNGRNGQPRFNTLSPPGVAAPADLLPSPATPAVAMPARRPAGQGRP